MKKSTFTISKRLKAKRKVINRKMRLMEKKRLGEWAAFLKDDCDFDYAYVLYVLRFKLARVREYIRTHDLVSDAGKISSEIGAVLKLLDRVIKDDYESEHVGRFMRKHGLRTRCRIGKDGKFDSGIPDSLSNEFLAACDAAFLERKEDLRKAFDLMTENMWSWWD